MSSVKTVTAETLVNAPVEKVWEYWVNPLHIAKWNNPSDDWHTPRAENDLRVGGRLFLRMEGKDGGFDFEAIYDEIITNKKIRHTTTDGRQSVIVFTNTANGIQLTETFETTPEHPAEMQQAFCQAILNNFKRVVEKAN